MLDVGQVVLYCTRDGSIIQVLYLRRVSVSYRYSTRGGQGERGGMLGVNELGEDVEKGDK